MSATTYVVLLRGINVGGHKQVAMADLRGLLTDLGFAEPRSLLQSGNLVFRSRARGSPPLERLLEKEAGKRLGLQIDFFVRTAAEWEAIIAQNPFPAEARRDPAHLAVMFLRDAPDSDALRALKAAVPGPEKLRAGGRQLYVVYPNGFARTRLTHALIEKKLRTRGTARNWNTVLKLGVLAGESFP